MFDETPGTQSKEIYSERRERVIAAFMAHPEQFDMDDWSKETICGTTRCIGGWASHVMQLEEGMPEDYMARVSLTETWLGLTTGDLFYRLPDNSDDLEGIHNVTEGAAALRAEPYSCEE